MVTNPQLVGESQAYLELLERVSRLAALDRPTLMTGERGTGKELFAARLHFLSPRWEGPYVKLSCAALPPDQLDRRLFGVENDGISSLGRTGAIEAASGGTLFLDEVTALPDRLQEKLLRVIEYGEMERVEGDDTVEVDVRVVAATSEPQSEATAKLRPDLLDHLAFGIVPIPALRERREDIAPLVTYFGKQVAADVGLDHFPGFTAEATEELMTHGWPGNVRELKTVVGRSIGLVTLSREQNGEDMLAPFDDVRFSTTITDKWAEEAEGPKEAPDEEAIPAGDNPPQLFEGDAPAGPDFTSRVGAFERNLLTEAMTRNAHHQGRAADYLGLSYHQFRGLLKKHGFKK